MVAIVATQFAAARINHKEPKTYRTVCKHLAVEFIYMVFMNEIGHPDTHHQMDS